MPFSRLRKGAFCIFLNPRLNGKPGVVHLYWQLMALRSSNAPDTTEEVAEKSVATVYKGNIIKNLIMDCQSYTRYRPNETTGGIFVSWRRKEELPTGA